MLLAHSFVEFAGQLLEAIVRYIDLAPLVTTGAGYLHAL